jgi:biopolymer transport protein ExbD
MAKRESQLAGKVAVDMTPMIDVVFQLLTFFMLTLKTVITEGDFEIRMPLGPSQGAVDDNPIPPVRVKIMAGPDGDRIGIAMNGSVVADFDDLRRRILDLVGSGPGSNADKTEVELDCDYQLKYVNVVNAISAVSGVVQPDGTVVEMIKKIKLTPPKRAGQ